MKTRLDLAKSPGQLRMSTDTKELQQNRGHPQDEWITRLEIRVYSRPSVVYNFFGWPQLPFLGLTAIDAASGGIRL